MANAAGVSRLEESSYAEASQPIAWHGRALFGVGFLVTVSTGAGLYVAPASVGESFAWTIRAPLTAAFIGAGYLAGAAFGLALALRSGIWPRARIVAAAALVLLTTNLIATIRFFDEFALDEGSTVQRLVAWSWLIVYTVLPPALVAVFAAHERTGGRRGWAVSEPLTAFTRLALAAIALAFAALGMWLTASPGTLAAAWPWRLPPISASIVGTWLLTFSGACAWALVERDWRRVRIIVAPLASVIVLHFVAAARLADTFTGSAASVAIYVGTLALCLAALAGASVTQSRARNRVDSP